MGLNDSITLSFMIVGHTKFSPDSCFGLLKQQFRKTYVESLQDITDVVTKSASCNSVEVVGWEDGISLIPTYDWSSYFAKHLNKVTGIKKFQHFTFNKSSMGMVLCRENSTSSTITVDIRKTEKWKPSKDTLPSIILPKGLDGKRQWYLFEKIRPFIATEEKKNITCPLPTCPKPCSFNRGSPAPDALTDEIAEEDPDSPRPPPPKKQRICGVCGESGHNARTCKHK